MIKQLIVLIIKVLSSLSTVAKRASCFYKVKLIRRVMLRVHSTQKMCTARIERLRTLLPSTLLVPGPTPPKRMLESNEDWDMESSRIIRVPTQPFSFFMSVAPPYVSHSLIQIRIEIVLPPQQPFEPVPQSLFMQLLGVAS